jgi:L-fuconolactonase
VIDSHQHFWKYDPVQYGWIDDTMARLRGDFLPADAKREMQAAGVASCIAIQARQTIEETRWLLDQAAAHPFIAAVVGWIDLQGDVDAQLAELGEAPGLAGVRHIVQGEADGFLERPAFLEGIAHLERHGLAYDILVYERQLPAATAFARRFPRQRFVLDHLGKPDVRTGAFDEWRRQVESLADLPHVWCKLSGLVTEADWSAWTPAQLRPYLDAALEAFGPARVMMGTDWPVCLVAASYAEAVALITEAIGEYSDDEQRQILGGNARHFWNLK